MAMDRFRHDEGSTRIIAFDVLDETGAVVPAASITAATLLLLDLETYVPGASPAEGIINGRDDHTILNTNNVAILDPDSPQTYKLVTWTMQPADNPIVNSRRQVERHLARFAFAWSTGSFAYVCEIDVNNLRGSS